MLPKMKNFGVLRFVAHMLVASERQLVLTTVYRHAGTTNEKGRSAAPGGKKTRVEQKRSRAWTTPPV